MTDLEHQLLAALWQAWKELNDIRARDGVPYTSKLFRAGVSEEYFSTVVDNCAEAITAATGEPPQPWPPSKQCAYPASLAQQNMANESVRNTSDISDAKSIAEAGDILQASCYEAAKSSGWHNDLGTDLPRTTEENSALFPTRIALCHSELSEALEGHRKSLPDDKLPHRPMAEVELADTVIRVFDLAGAMGYDLGGAISEKLAYNAKRADHKAENRRADGGKQY